MVFGMVLDMMKLSVGDDRVEAEIKHRYIDLPQQVASLDHLAQALCVLENLNYGQAGLGQLGPASGLENIAVHTSNPAKRKVAKQSCTRDKALKMRSLPQPLPVGRANANIWPPSVNVGPSESEAADKAISDAQQELQFEDFPAWDGSGIDDIVLVGPSDHSMQPLNFDAAWLCHDETGTLMPRPVRSRPGVLYLSDVMALKKSSPTPEPLSFGSVPHLCGYTSCRPCMFERRAGRCKKGLFCDFCHLHSKDAPMLGGGAEAPASASSLTSFPRSTSGDSAYSSASTECLEAW